MYIQHATKHSLMASVSFKQETGRLAHQVIECTEHHLQSTLFTQLFKTVLHRTTEVLPTTSEPLRPNTTNVLPTMSEQVLPDTQKVSPTTSKPVVQSSLLSSKLETSPNATPTKLGITCITNFMHTLTNHSSVL